MNKPLLSSYCCLQSGIIMIKDEREHQSRSHCVIYSTSLSAQWLWTKKAHDERRRRETSAKTLSAAALLNKYLPPFYNPILFELTLIKVDCWLNKKQIVDQYVMLLLIPGSTGIVLICWLFLIHTVSFNLALLNWHGKASLWALLGKSLR